ncbi:hypothetical protein AB1Y20_014732 [Prymnesium parvum]|uniref:Uncharacterized protein n=1 Tax=Prymnesium parvum TaxID=97485 RepID=A0AB34IEB1_PRYPA
MLLRAGKRASESEVTALLADQVNKKDKDGRLPLHIAVDEGKSEGVVTALLAAFPEAVKEKDKDGSLPLHIAIDKGASEGVVTALLAAFPEAVKEKDEDGRLPLRIAIDKGASEGVVTALLAAFPEAAKEKGKDWSLPLHIAIDNRASEGVVTALLATFPEAVKEKDGDGRLPLRIAIDKGASEGVVTALLAAFPEAVKEKGKLDGRLPLRIAIGIGASEGAVTALLAAFPEAVKEKDGRGGLPLHIAIDNRASEGVVTALLAADIRVFLAEPARSHAFSWTHCVSTPSPLCVLAVQRVLSTGPAGFGYGKHIVTLAEVVDEQGRAAIDIVSRGAKQAIHEHLLFCGRYQLHFGPPEHRSATSVVLRARDNAASLTDYGAVFDKFDANPKDGILNTTEMNLVAVELGLDALLFIEKGADATNIGVSRDAFVATCKRLLGDGPREVVLKLMQDETQWKRESWHGVI